MTLSNILRGQAWHDYRAPRLRALAAQVHDLQVALYRATWNYTPIYKIGDYYFLRTIRDGEVLYSPGYKNLSALKRLL